MKNSTFNPTHVRQLMAESDDPYLVALAGQLTDGQLLRLKQLLTDPQALEA
jgi:hypothetical protein